MPDFSQIKKLDITADKTAVFIFYNIVGEPELTVRPATEVNKQFFNALLRRARKNNKAVQAGAINAGMISANRDEDRDLYSQFVISGWKKVVDADDKEVEFTQQNCLDFLKALPDFEFDDLRQFASNPITFNTQDSIDVGATAKN